MVNKKLVLVIALMVVAVGVITLGARQNQGATVPPGPIVVSPNAGVNDRNSGTLPDAPALPAAAAPVAFQDDFSGDLSDWETVQTAPATWGVRDGRLQQWGDATGEPADVPSVLAIRSLSFTDGKLEAYVFPTSGEPVGLAFRGSDAGYYRLDLYPNLPNKASKAILQRVTSQGAQKIAETSADAWQGFTYNAWQPIVIDLAGGSITASVGGREVLRTNDTTFSSGWAGVWTFANTGAQFDNVRIQSATSR